MDNFFGIEGFNHHGLKYSVEDMHGKTTWNKSSTRNIDNKIWNQMQNKMWTNMKKDVKICYDFKIVSG